MKYDWPFLRSPNVNRIQPVFLKKIKNKIKYALKLLRQAFVCFLFERCPEMIRTWPDFLKAAQKRSKQKPRQTDQDDSTQRNILTPQCWHTGDVTDKTNTPRNNDEVWKTKRKGNRWMTRYTHERIKHDEPKTTRCKWDRKTNPKEINQHMYWIHIRSTTIRRHWTFSYKECRDLKLWRRCDVNMKQ